MYTVNIMMSTYNGEKFVIDQIKSILTQKNVNVKLLIRDDGSTDSTVSLIKNLNSDRIDIYCGNNIGWKRSFLDLVDRIEYREDEYYAFSDQDDIWLEDKLFRAVSYLESKKSEKVRCYCSNQTFVNERLEKISSPKSKRYAQTNEYHVISNGFGMGCTEVFSAELLLLIKNGKVRYPKISHDLIVSLIGTYLGHIYRDTESYILYRQHDFNAGSKKESFFQKIMQCMDFDEVVIQDNSKYILSNFYDRLSEKQIRILESFTQMHKVRNKFALIFNRYVSRDTFFGTLKLKFYIVLH